MKKYVVVTDFTSVVETESAIQAKREAFEQLREAIYNMELQGSTDELLDQIFEIDKEEDIDNDD